MRCQIIHGSRIQTDKGGAWSTASAPLHGLIHQREATICEGLTVHRDAATKKPSRYSLRRPLRDTRDHPKVKSDLDTGRLIRSYRAKAVSTASSCQPRSCAATRPLSTVGCDGDACHRRHGPLSGVRKVTARLYLEHPAIGSREEAVADQ